MFDRAVFTNHLDASADQHHRCSCAANHNLDAPPPDLAQYDLYFADNPNKATITPDKRIKIDPTYWEGLSEASRLALLYHEAAHDQNGSCAKSCDSAPQGCERCADRRAGACMRQVGYSLEATKAAFRGLKIQTRSTPEFEASQGWRAVGDNQAWFHPNARANHTNTPPSPDPYFKRNLASMTQSPLQKKAGMYPTPKKDSDNVPTSSNSGQNERNGPAVQTQAPRPQPSPPPTAKQPAPSGGSCPVCPPAGECPDWVWLVGLIGAAGIAYAALFSEK